MYGCGLKKQLPDIRLLGIYKCQAFFFFLSIAIHFLLVPYFYEYKANVSGIATSESSGKKNFIEVSLERRQISSAIYKNEESDPVKSALLPSDSDEHPSQTLSNSASPYYPAQSLTSKPVVIRDIEPDFNLGANGGPSQAAVLTILINEYGDIDNVIIDQSLLPESAQNLIVKEFRNMKFKPGEIDGLPVKSELKIEVLLSDIEIRNNGLR